MSVVIAVTVAGCLARAAAPAAVPFESTVIRAGGDPDPVLVADFNHDGKADIAAANPDAGTVTVLLGDGERHFTPAPGSPFEAGHMPNDIGVGDFDGDGNLDLVIANHQTPYVTLLLGDGKGGFRPAPHSPFATTAKPHPHGLAVGRFCGAGSPLDVVIDSWGNEQIELLEGDGHGALTNGPMFPAGPGSDTPLGSADFDGNGTPDIVMPDTAIGRWNSTKGSALLSDGHCGFRPAPGSPFEAGAVPWSVAVGRLNDDAYPDLVILPYGPQVANPRDIAATVLRGNGKGGFAPMSGSPFALPGCANPRRASIGDVDGDGVPDFVVSCSHRDSVLVFHGRKAGGFDVSAVRVPTGSADNAVAERGVLIAPVVAGRPPDIVASNGSAGTITLLFVK